MVHEPAPVSVTRLPVTEQLPSAVNVTGFPDAPGVALTMNAASPKVFAARASKTIDCGSCSTVTVNVTSFWLCEASVALQVTGVAPIGNVSPERWVQTTIGAGSTTS